ncbi:MAG TPA: hypothetical protein VJK51_05335 [Candidatus Nanoarchaeia archaeon]|nr:hypothetical protein [Candidatus Nanoarchaeia archaeon]
MNIDLLKNIVSSVVGKQSVGIVDLLYGKRNVNEFLIAKKLKLTINQTRNILYRLSDEGLVSFIRKKDSKKGGWYTYFWTLNSGKSLHKFYDKLRKDMELMQQSLSTKKSEQFFNCPSCGKEYSQEQALLHNYTCPECGEVMLVKDVSSEIAELEKSLVLLKRVLDEVSTEMSLLDEKEAKAKNRKLKRETKKKTDARKLARKKLTKSKLTKKSAKVKKKSKRR